ncbi:MAG: FAD-dependent oxidoreductase, partial [Chloroflexi bacterium]|nr:FAD-dependent oxidoreductase [Chloroflexota bacterium]
MTTEYDAIIVGSGQAGGPLGTALVGAGYRTALIESEHVGGTCINEGCTPTKTMVASARVAYLARRAAEYGVHTGPIQVDMQRVRERKRQIVDSFRTGSERQIVQGGVSLVRGQARFVDVKTLEVDGQQFHAERIFINTGARPTRPSLAGLESVSALDSTSIMELDQVPEHLLVLGGGYVGLEFGQMFRRFGARVSVIQRAAKLLAREDDDVADAVAEILRGDGIDVYLNTSAERIERAGGSLRLTISSGAGGAGQVLEGSHVLLAVGRTPNTDRLNLAATGLETDAAGFLPVNERLETSVAGIYALGDVKGGPAFTHISYDDFRIVRT